MDNKEILKQRYNTVKEECHNIKTKYLLENSVEIVAVTKYTSMNVIKDFLTLNTKSPLAESKAQSLRDRAGELEDEKWHFIGRIQSNKIKYLVDYATLIQSVDSIEIASEISKIALKKNKVIDILLEFNISGEMQKGGYNLKDYRLFYDEVSKFGNIKIMGLMGMASYTDNTLQVEHEFESLKKIFDDTKGLNILSMGMSGDYKLAVKHGSNMIRIGSFLFDDLK